jgi:carboxyl-terminal processing protease
MPKLSKILISMLLVVIIALAFGGGFALGKTSGSGTPAGLDVVGQAWNYILTDYVDRAKLSSENMSRAAIEGIVASLNDPYTSYLSAAEYDSFNSSLSGEFVGIGVIVSIRDKKLMIIAVFPDSPAAKAGLKPGDNILKINEESTDGMSLDIAASKIRGQAGTIVRLLILHEGESTPVEVEITRARVEIPSIHFEMRGNIAYIDIAQFTERTETELAPILQKLGEENAKGIILDLRGNPGGFLDILVEVASYFMNEGIIVKVKSNLDKIDTYSVSPGVAHTSLPMVVLVDNFSASSSEVLAGALQDHHRAIISGNTTYGKGSVNILHRLSDGSGLYITTARWLTPNGRLIEGYGIEPDVKLELSGEDAINWAVDYLTKHESYQGGK